MDSNERGICYTPYRYERAGEEKNGGNNASVGTQGGSEGRSVLPYSPRLPKGTAFPQVQQAESVTGSSRTV